MLLGVTDRRQHTDAQRTQASRTEHTQSEKWGRRGANPAEKDICGADSTDFSEAGQEEWWETNAAVYCSAFAFGNHRRSPAEAAIKSA